MLSYKCLDNQVVKSNDFEIVPLRFEDRFDILKWRNEQMYHLRQAKLLTVDDQDKYFNNVIKHLFDQDTPNQILFSLLKNDEFIGYGGLVHINWIDKNAEISFLMNTEKEKDNFHFNWVKYLSLIEKVAFEDLRFHKIFTYAFDLRPHLYPALLEAGFLEEARLNEHCLFNGNYTDVIIHSKINTNANF
ncbi:GNAT family N-acetyltransferase [Flavobacterium aestivum]|uniref:GNAT family N-acetyltransferase n=1 Tax=Flavobacterium aestivum TaxID=3003257 RepID=UPI002285B18E|nr:GNAT family N-acetyltransferase [Flavobacterium aestivum]